MLPIDEQMAILRSDRSKGAPLALSKRKLVEPAHTNYPKISTISGLREYELLSIFSRDISIPRPATGNYYLLVEARKSFHELLITAIMDTPPGTSVTCVSCYGHPLQISNLVESLCRLYMLDEATPWPDGTRTCGFTQPSRHLSAEYN